MLKQEERMFFISIAQNARTLSDCPCKHGATLIRNGRILSYGFNRRIIGEHEISAVMDTLFGAKDQDLTGSTLISTSMPSLEEFKLIVTSGISTVYFFGKIENKETVKFLNALTKNGKSLEIIQLES